ncbi:MAG: Rrf2 family transcriptional regulator [Chloroflexia bacterium]|nr:Rrf2 family transcriptional regulator [Chloroflexia bacterium]
MRLSKRGEYGLRAMILLASAPKQTPMMQLKGIAATEHIPIKFLEQIMLALKNAGLLHSKMGIGGGYYLAKPAQDITLGKIVRILDGPLAPIGCVSQMAYEPCNCPDEATCQLRAVMGNVRNAISDILDHTSLADVANNQLAPTLRQELHQDLGDQLG